MKKSQDCKHELLNRMFINRNDMGSDSLLIRQLWKPRKGTLQWKKNSWDSKVFL